MSYSTSIGRFLERDPEGYVDGMNDYEFVRDNPLNATDPTGLTTDGNTPNKPAPGYTPIEPEFYESPKEGQPCSCGGTHKPVTVKLVRTDGPTTRTWLGWQAHPSIKLDITGDYEDLKIRWWTCWRADGTSGQIQGSADQTSATYYLGHPLTSGTYLTTAEVSYVSCDSDGKKHTHVWTAGGSYIPHNWPYYYWEVNPPVGTPGTQQK